MANSYTQIFVQYVFSPKGKQSMIPKAHREDVQKYMTGIIQNRKHKLLAIYCMPDHVHILIGMHPMQSIAKLASEIKTESTKYIKTRPWMPFAFSWQVGYGGFSYSYSQVGLVARYILNQEKHHKKQTFKEEYMKMLKAREIPFDDRFLFEFYD